MDPRNASRQLLHNFDKKYLALQRLCSYDLMALYKSLYYYYYYYYYFYLFIYFFKPR